MIKIYLFIPVTFSGDANDDMTEEGAKHLCKKIVDWTELACLDVELDELTNEVIHILFNGKNTAKNKSNCCTKSLLIIYIARSRFS